MKRTLLEATAAAALAQLITIAPLWGSGLPVTSAFFASHFTVLWVLYVLAYLLLSRWRAGRPGSDLLLFLPGASLLASWAGYSAVSLAVIAMVACAALIKKSPPGSPPPRRSWLAATVFGSSLAALLGCCESSAALKSPPLLFVVVALFATALFGLRALLERWARQAVLTTPLAPRRSLGVLLLFGLATTTAYLAFPSPSWQAPLAPGEERPADSKGPVVLIVLDTVRADFLSCYGEDPGCMPRLSAWADQHTVIFDHSIANGSSSLASHASLFTGLYPPRHGAHKPFSDDPQPPAFAYPLASDLPTLAEILAEAGFWCVGLSANFGPLAADFGLGRGFHFYQAEPSRQRLLRKQSAYLAPLQQHKLVRWCRFLESLPWFSAAEFILSVPYVRAEEMTSRAIEVIDAAGQQPFFLFVNYMDAHSPYWPPAAVREGLTGHNPALGKQDIWQSAARKILSGERLLSTAERDHLLALYRAELEYLDQHLDRLLRHLQSHPRFSELQVVITSDHGEAFGEHQTVKHAATLYQEAIGVPFLLKPATDSSSGLQPGSRRSDLIQAVDAFAGILVDASVPAPESIDGLPWGQGRSHALSWLYVYQNLARVCPQRFDRQLRTVQTHQFKLISSSEAQAELYDLRVDPGETQDLAATQQGLCLQLQEILDRIPERRPEVGEQQEADEVLERLRSLGYTH